MVFKSAVTMVLGMSEGGSIWRFAPDGVKQLAEAEIKWDKRGSNTYWNKSWLLEFTGLARSYKNDDDCFISGMPGADLAIMSDERESGGIQEYQRPVRDC
ncbi:MAG: hypothetical protein WC650_04555 [Candidatus Doudnabacteria bacterium]